MSKRRYDRYSGALGALYAALLGIAGCAAQPAPEQDNRQQPLIMDQLHNGGTVGFLFLPPMVPRPAHLGDIVPDLPVTVQIDETDGGGKVVRTVATFTHSSGAKNERVRYHAKDTPPDADDNDGDTDPMGFYLVRWHTDDASLSLEAIYRARVLVPARGGKVRELGFADVDVVRNQKQFRSVDRTDFTPLINGQTLRIKFRIDRPAVDADGDGVLDWQDSCPAVANADQADSLGNGIGDACRCGSLPADFGGIHCTAAFASCGGDGKALSHNFAGTTGRTGHVSVACTSARPVADAKLATAVHSAPLLVACDQGVTFDLDPALGSGVHKATTKADGTTYSLGFDHSFATEAAPCAAAEGTCDRVRFDVHLALDELQAQKLANCRLFFSATATRGVDRVQNGRVTGQGETYPVLGFDGVRLTGADAGPACGLHPLDGKALNGGPSSVRTRCGGTSENSLVNDRLPTLCRNQVATRGTVERSSFADLGKDYSDAQQATIADLGRIGQVHGAVCAGGAAVLNQVDSFALPRPAGATSVTAKAVLNAAPGLVQYYHNNIDVSLAVKADGLPPLELAKGLPAAELEKGVQLSVPELYAKGANPRTVVQGRLRPGSLPAPVGADQIICFFEDGIWVCAIMDVDTGLAQGQVQYREGSGPVDKLDLCLDVDVK